MIKKHGMTSGTFLPGKEKAYETVLQKPEFNGDDALW